MKSWCVVIAALAVLPAAAQVLTTAETTNDGEAIMPTENRSFVDGVQLNVAYLQYIRGLTKSFDLYLSVGETQFFRESQAFAGVGGNWHIARVKKVDMSIFNVATVPLSRRREASVVLLDSAFLVSRELTKTISLYTGVNGLIPIGKSGRGFFTPTKKKLNFPLGLSVQRGNWIFFSEIDLGRSLTSVGGAPAYITQQPPSN